MANGNVWAPLILRVRDLVQSRNHENQLVAVRLAQTAALKDPTNPLLHHALARAALTAEDYGTAERAYRQTVALNPQDVEAWNGLAIVLTRVCRSADALEAVDRALAVNPKSAAAHVTRSDVLRDLHRYDEAGAGYETALWLKPNWPDACYNRAFWQFGMGRYEAGWRDYARRWETREFPPEQEIFQIKPDMRRWGPRWGGVPLAPGTRLLVWAEQGHGDTLWGLRYLDLLLATLPPDVSVILQVQGPVYRHVWINYRDRCTVLSRAMECPRWDVHVPLLNLPNVLGAWTPAVAPPARLRTEPGDALPRPSGYRVGIVWGGSLAHTNDPRRSTALGDWVPLLRVPGVQFVSLQIGPRADEGAPLFAMGLVDPRPVIRDFADTANVIAGLDLVVGVDTGTLHLAAGLGVATWWLIGESPDWRYSWPGDDPTANVWYRGARLWRKPPGAAWDDTLAAVAAALDRTLDDRLWAGTTT